MPPPPLPRAELPAPAAGLRASLLAWYDAHGRELSWRPPPGRTPEPWGVLVSEMMLQQTGVAMVGPRFGPFMARFPTPAAMAAASLEDVLHAWQGLGYYRRARALHVGARALVERHGGAIPADMTALRAIPGIGPYTAAAVAAIAFGAPAVPVDGNVERVLARVAAVDTPFPRARRLIVGLAADLAGPERPGDLAQGLMDLGSTVCTFRSPACMICPWAGPCVARARGIAAELPRKRPNARQPDRRALVFLLRREGDGAFLFRRRPWGGMLPGMVELPSSPWDRGGGDDGPPLAHAPVPGLDWRPLPGAVRHVFSHFTATLELTRAELPPGAAGPEGGLWAPPGAFAALALPSFTRNLLAHAGLAEPSLKPGPRPKRRAAA